MKRSEVISILLKEFPSWNDQIELDEYDAHGILYILENIGMEPPPLSKEVYDINDDGIFFLLRYKLTPDPEKGGDHTSNWEAEEK